jgi:2-polyprenyl-6-methoxyphenol hydroxylase-like FAD-dependent oxidoreductase
LLEEVDQTKIHLNKKLSNLNQSNQKVTLTFEDDHSIEADYVIGADGINSVVRKSIFGEMPLRYSGQTCWRGITKFTLPADKQMNSYEMWGKQKGLRFGFVATAPNEIYYFTTFFAKANGRDDPNKVKESLLKNYACFGQLATEIIEATPNENIIRSDIFDLQPIKKWWSNKVVLLGDAAHATTPNLGQGGCQAVEDGYVIAKCLKENSSIEKAFEHYQNIRYKKALHVVNMSWSFGRMTNIGSPILQSLRNGFMRMMPESMAIKQLDKILKLNY